MHQAAQKLVTDEGGADGLALRRVHDRAEVEELLIRYTMSVDLRDWGLFRSCFAERVSVRFDPPIDDLPDEPLTPEEWAAFAGAGLDAPGAGQHYYSIYSMHVGGGEAEAVMYYREGLGEQVDAPPFGRSIYYTYRCRRTHNGWKLAEISAHALPESMERGPGPDASFGPIDEPLSQARPRRRSGKGSRHQAPESKRPHRSAAKRR